MTDRVLLIAGLGRCGTTCVMNMLWRGGVPVGGPPPVFEADEMGRREVDLPWLRAQAGKAVKWVDPLLFRLAPGALRPPPAIVLLSRDPKEQAKSQLKFLSPVFAGFGHRDQRRAMAASVARDTRRLASTLEALGTVYHLTFKFLLNDPQTASRKLAAITHSALGADLDIAAAASVVRRRSARCAPDLSIEEAYLA